MGMRWRLALSAVALLGWLAYLGYAALTKSRDPIVSQAQAAAATAAVVVKVESEANGKPVPQVKITGPVLWGDGLEDTVAVPNLAEARGFAGTGEYLLLLTWTRGVWLVVGQQRSPGSDLPGVGPLIYPWTDDVRKQTERFKELVGKSGP